MAIWNQASLDYCKSQEKWLWCRWIYDVLNSIERTWISPINPKKSVFDSISNSQCQRHSISLSEDFHLVNVTEIYPQKRPWSAGWSVLLSLLASTHGSYISNWDGHKTYTTTTLKLFPDSVRSKSSKKRDIPRSHHGTFTIFSPSQRSCHCRVCGTTETSCSHFWVTRNSSFKQHLLLVPFQRCARLFHDLREGWMVLEVPVQFFFHPRSYSYTVVKVDGTAPKRWRFVSHDKSIRMGVAIAIYTFRVVLVENSQDVPEFRFERLENWDLFWNICKTQSTWDLICRWPLLQVRLFLQSPSHL